ncbi:MULTISPECIES: DUF4157 domain-containing protein [unclassified Pseudoalteromonas]|uniref:eCIS core domain-containing protein n=1 Tax=unclassified Pseudoalteromonas TaxID=194690 RepID=UPI0020977F77|nr:DUF4157 domain-containing protein [Pseudoalteromonas sp. XMcav2-N]MCO7188550.1 DUF4157 domain-containing protein [Pseudoalteromonas sp. XMcav2-N]
MSQSTGQYKRNTAKSSQQAAQKVEVSPLVDNRRLSTQLQKNNTTGLPDNLKSGMESLSGMSLDHVKVHYNSSKPAQVQAHAYAQGSDIHLAPGQAHHLPHELGHIVQQAQGRVKPTTQVNGVNVNDDAALEHEADIMGARALQLAYDHHSQSQTRTYSTLQAQPLNKNHTAQFKPVQGMEDVNYAVMSQDSYQLWQQSRQGTAQLHGKCVDGNTVVVTQFQDKALGVQQQFSLGSKAKGLLLITEGVLTAIAGGVVLAASHGTLAIPGLLSICIGASKFARGVITMLLGDKKPADSNGAKFWFGVMDALRTLEAGTSIASAVLSGGSLVKVTSGWVFGIAKSIRSICTLIANYLKGDKERAKKKARLLSFVNKVASVAHWVEVAAATVIGGDSLATGTTKGVITGATGLGTALSKGVRAKDQHDKAWPRPENE